MFIVAFSNVNNCHVIFPNQMMFQTKAFSMTDKTDGTGNDQPTQDRAPGNDLQLPAGEPGSNLQVNYLSTDFHPLGMQLGGIRVDSNACING